MSLIITTQSFRSVPLICRSNASAYVLFKSHNKKEIEKLDEELGGMFLDFQELYEKATKDKFSFLYLDMEKATAWRKYEELLYEK